MSEAMFSSINDLLIINADWSLKVLLLPLHKLLSSATSHGEMPLLAVKMLSLISNRYRPHKYPALQFPQSVFLYQQNGPLLRQKELQEIAQYVYQNIGSLRTSNKTVNERKGKLFQYIKPRLSHL